MNSKIRSQSEKIKDILAKFENINEEKNLFIKGNQDSKVINTIDKQTISDDFKIEGAKEKQILHYEEIIRKTLEMFDLNYDDLIRMDGKSAYCKAVEFYPHLIDEVKSSKCPPLTALHIAKSMKPYIEFTQKYGSSLKDIKQNLKNEINNEKSSKISEAVNINKSNTKPVEQASMFSDISNAITQSTPINKTGAEDESLASIFYR